MFVGRPGRGGIVDAAEPDDSRETFCYSVREASATSGGSNSSQSSNPEALIVNEDSANIVSDKTATDIFNALDKAAGTEKKDFSSDSVDFAKRKESLPAPKSGNIITHDFPAKDGDNVNAPAAISEDTKEPLTILRYAPQGVQRTQVANVSITFSQPIIPVATLEDLSKGSVPCTLTADNDNGRYSQENGAWRWIGTQMIKFEPHGGRRLPMSTHFAVNVPKLTSVTGNALEAPFAFEFDTPTVRATSAYPNGISSRSPLIFIRFDQRVEPQKLIRFLKLNIPGKTPLDLDLVKDLDEILANESKQTSIEVDTITTNGNFLDSWKNSISARVEETKDQTPSRLCSLIRSAQHDSQKDLTEKERKSTRNPQPFFVVCRIAATPTNKKSLGNDLLLPNATQVKIMIGKGLPSAEGALTTQNDQEFSFSTYAALDVTHVNNEKKLAPSDSFNFNFNNPLEVELMKTISNSQWNELLQVTPPLDVTVTVSSNRLNIRGPTKGNTEYKVKLGGWLVDVYGQSFRNLSLEDSSVFTFNVGNARQYMRAHREGMFIIDPATLGNPTFDVTSVNYRKLEVSLFQVSWKDYDKSIWGRQCVRSQKQRSDQSPHELIGSVGKLAVSKVITIDGYSDDQAITSRISVSEAIAAQKGKNSFGHVIVVIDVCKDDFKESEYNLWISRPRLTAWLQITDIGVDIFPNATEQLHHCFISSLRTGKPLPKAKAKLAEATAQSNEEGMLTIPMLTNSRNVPSLIVKHGRKSVIIPNTTQIAKQNFCQTKFYVVDDRQLYKPGESIHFKGFVRLFSYDYTSNSMKLRSIPKSACESTKVENALFYISYSVRDARRAEIVKHATLSIDAATGGFDGSFKLEDNVNLGRAIIQFKLEGADKIKDVSEYFSDPITSKKLGPARITSYNHSHTFKIEEFRRPEFSVSSLRVDTANDGTPRHACFGDIENAIVECDAQYYSGGPLNNATVQWRVSGSSTTYKPPGIEHGYQFGSSSDRISLGYFRSRSGRRNPFASSINVQTNSLGISDDENLRTGPNGTNRIALDFAASHLTSPQPILLNCEASVVDLNRQTLSSSTSVLVHPSLLYIGAKRSSYFVNLPKCSQEDKNEFFDFIIVDVEGKSVAGVAMELKVKQGSTVVHEEVFISKKSKNSPEPIRFNLFADNFKFAGKLTSGPATIEVTVTDREGRANETKTSVYLSVDSDSRGSLNNELSESSGTMCTQDALILIPNKEQFEVGDVARVLVSSPWDNGRGNARSGVWSLWNQRTVFYSERFDFTGKNSHEIEFEIKEGFIGRGSTCLSVDIVGEAEREPGKEMPTRTACAQGKLSLDVPPLSRKLSAIIENDENVRPGEETRVHVSVQDNKGNFVPNCSLCVFAVDEAVLALAGYSLVDPMNSFYHNDLNHQVANPRVTKNRQNVFLVNPGALSLDGQLGIPEVQHRNSLLKRCAPAGGGRGGRGGMANSMAMKSSMSRAAPEMMMMCMADSGPNAEMGEEPTVGEIKVRSNFDALAAWIPNGSTPQFTLDSKITKEQASTEFVFNMPDSLTRYRICCIAVSGSDYFGLGESFLTAALPLQVKPSPPRFLNFGDNSQISLIVRNQSPKPMKGVCVVLRSLNQVATRNSSVPGVRVNIPANDRVELRFPVAALNSAGTARFQAAVVGDANTSDAAEFDFPIWTPATSEAFATYGELDDDNSIAVQNVCSPSAEQVWPQFGELSVSVTSTALQSMVDAFLYVYNYEYGCVEQRASRILSSVAMRDVIDAFSKVDESTGQKAPSGSEIEKMIYLDFDFLEKQQDQATGGFAFWNGSNISVYVTIHVALAVSHALLHKYEVNKQMATKLEQFCTLTNCEGYLTKFIGAQKDFDSGIFLNLLCKAHSVRRRLVQVLGLNKNSELQSESDTLFQRINKKLNSPKGSTAVTGTTMIETIAYLLPSLFHYSKTQNFKKAKQWMMSCVQETAETACFATHNSTAEAGFLILQSARRADALVLESLIETEPESSLCSKLLKGLFAHRRSGRWRTTQENTAVLLAVDCYFRTFEKEEPDFDARCWLGDTYCLSESFKGRSVDTYVTNVPMQTLCNEISKQGTTGARDSVPLVIQKCGAPGRLYYRVGLKYAPRSLDLAPLQAGFTVTRNYSSIDRDSDVLFDSKENVYKIRAGARVRVSLTMTNQTRRYHVALVDYLPAAFEPLNPALKGTGNIPPVAFNNENNVGKYCWWRGPWYEHQNFRDERVEAFCSYLSAGVHEYTYVASCTQIGTFVVPPAKAEEMYSPEVFGRSQTEKVIVIE